MFIELKEKYLNQEINTILNEINNNYKKLIKTENNIKKYKYLKNNINNINDFYKTPCLKNKSSKENINFNNLYENINKLYENIVFLIKKIILKEFNKNLFEYQSILFKNLEPYINKIDLSYNIKKNIYQITNIRNTVSHNIFFKYFIVFLMTKNDDKIIFENKINNFIIIEEEYKLIFKNYTVQEYKKALEEDFLTIKLLIKQSKNNTISIAKLEKDIELPLINIYQAIIEINNKYFNTKNVKKTVYESSIFSKEDMKIITFLHDFKHHTIHKKRKISDEFGKYNLIKKLIPKNNLTRKRKRKSVTTTNMIENIKLIFEKYKKEEVPF